MRVLMLTPWPFRVPRNGGQLRASAVKQAYQAGGHYVYGAGLYNPAEAQQNETWPEDIPLKSGVINIMQALSADSAKSEMTFWNAVAAAPDSFASFVTALRAAQPDVLQFEEPVLIPVVRRLREEGYLDGVTVVHSSYNFETLAWQHRSVSGAMVSNDTLRDIAGFEREIAESCDLVVTVSESDANQFRRLGARRVCVAANGVACLLCPDLQAINAYLPSRPSYALFVSSAHPPNAHGLVDLAAASSHSTHCGEILICGRVAPLIRAASNYRKAARVLRRSRFLGWVDDTLLGALYSGARVVILPKLYSGGSNLKTAEALASGRPVVATSLAFEGFESFMGFPGVVIADEPDAFWNAVNERLIGKPVTITRSPEAVSGLLWQESLKPMVHEAEQAVQRRKTAGVQLNFSTEDA